MRWEESWKLRRPDAPEPLGDEDEVDENLDDLGLDEDDLDDLEELDGDFDEFDDLDDEDFDGFDDLEDEEDFEDESF